MSKFESFPKLDSTKLSPGELPTNMGVVKKSEQITSEKFLEAHENQEKSEVIMESARAQRVDLFKGIISRTKDFVTSPLILKGINLIPGYADIPIALGAIRGKEGTRKLSSRERLCYIVALGMVAVSYAHAYELNGTAFAIDTAIINTIMGGDLALMAIKESITALEKKSPKIAHIIGVASDYLSKKREELGNLKELLENSPTTSPESNTQ